MLRRTRIVVFTALMVSLLMYLAVVLTGISSKGSFLHVPKVWAASEGGVDLAGALGEGWTAEYHTDGRIRALRGGRIAASGKGEEAARDFLRSRANLFGLQESLADLRTEKVVNAGDAGSDVFFTQMVKGVPVVNGGVSVHFDGKARIFLVHSGYIPGLDLNTEPAISPEEAFGRLRSAWQKTPAKKSSLLAWFWPDLRIESSRKVIYAREGKGYLAYEIIAAGSVPRHRMKYYLDANTGGILCRTSLCWTATGTGNVIFPHPISRANNQSLRKTDGDAAFSGLYESQTLQDINFSGGNYSLQGPYVKMDGSLETPTNTPPVQPSSTFNFNIRYYPHTSTDHDLDQFDDVLGYWMIDTSQRYIQSLGFTSAANYQLPYDSHGLDNGFNAHYSPDGTGRGYIAFGSNEPYTNAYNDLGEDATVVLHEYGHAVQDNQNTTGFPVYAGACGGIMEGFADYWAGSGCYQANTTSGFPPSYIGAWAIKDIDDSNYLRDIDNSNIFPDNFDNEAHGAGELWGPVIWDVFQALGRDVADRLMLRANTLVPSDGAQAFDDMAQAILDADSAIYSGSHSSALGTVFTNRGIRTLSSSPSYASASYGWIDATGGTKISSFTGGFDDGYAEITLPFAFRLLGKNFSAGSTIFVFTDGAVHFVFPTYGWNRYGDASRIFLNEWFSEATSFAPMSLGVCSDDLVVGGGSAPADTGVYYAVTGSSPNRVLTIQWNKVRHYEADDLAANYTAIFEVNLYEGSNRITYQYNNMTFGGYPDANNGATAVSVLLYDKRKRVAPCDHSGTLTASSAFEFGAPAGPSNLTATAVSSTQIDLSWQDNSSNETGFKIERKIGASGTYVQIGTTAANVTIYSNADLTPSTTYYYRVCSYNAMGDSAYSNEASATTPSGDGTPPGGGATDGGVMGAGDSKGGCFIATAAYGSYLDPHVKVLRDFRDEHLQKYTAGRAFVNFYYRYSPPVADYIAKHETLKVVTRWMLTPVVYAVMYPSCVWLALLLVAAACVGRKTTRRRAASA